ncbi:hypothetical protein C8B47_30720, partial [filamentous cyanobacterium CCP4]
LPTARILLVDDNADMLDYVRRLLSPTYLVEAVRDGKAALAAIGQQLPDLVLSDVMMPELDGFELLRQLRADPHTRELPIILLSARAGEEARLEGLAAGADDYLTKPFSARELLARVEATLKLAQLRQETKVALQRSEERSRLAVQVAQLGTWRYNRRTNLVELDARMQDIWGQSAAQLPLHQLVEHIHPDDRERVASAVSAALEPGASGAYVIEYRIRRSDGTERWMAANGQAFFADRGGGVHRTMELLGTVHDITERKHTELLLAEQTRLLELIASGCPLEDCLNNLCATIARLNPHIRASFLLCDAERQRFSQAVSPDLPPSFRAEVSNLPINELCIGTCGEAVFSGQPVTCADIAHDERWSLEWRELCLAHGILAGHSVPVMTVEGLPFGSLMLCFDQARLPTPWEHQLAEFGAQVASIAFERDRATLALRDSEHRYRTLFESMEEGFGICEMLYDASGAPVDYRFLEINPAFEILSGITQIAGKTAKELVPNLEDVWVENYSRVLATGEPCRFEHASVPLGRWFSVSAFALNDPQNRRFAILFTDITDRRRAERDRERFLAVGSDLQVISGSDGYFKWVSPTLERLLGWTPAEMTARPWIEFVHPDDLSKSVTEDASLFSAGRETFSFENRYRHKDGSYRWFLWNARPYPDEQLLYAAAIDITELKRTESNLRESETRFRQMTDAAPMMVWISGLDQRCTYFNQSWLAFTGRTLEQEMGDGWTEGIHPDDFQHCLSTYTNAFNARTPFQIEYRLRHVSGEYRWIFDVGEPSEPQVCDSVYRYYRSPPGGARSRA